MGHNRKFALIKHYCEIQMFISENTKSRQYAIKICKLVENSIKISFELVFVYEFSKLLDGLSSSFDIFSYVYYWEKLERCSIKWIRS